MGEGQNKLPMSIEGVVANSEPLLVLFKGNRGVETHRGVDRISCCRRLRLLSFFSWQIRRATRTALINREGQQFKSSRSSFKF